MLKRSLLFALMLVALVASAEARKFPVDNQQYICYHYTDTGYYIGQGLARFDVNPSTSNFDIQRGIEYWSFGGTSDNRRFTFAKPNDLSTSFTRWEFTANLDHQCKETDVYNYSIFFKQCDNHQERDCFLF
jgi:hypothetical protein